MTRHFVFNCSTNVEGGTVQNAVNFILASVDDPDIEWSHLVSPQVHAELKKRDGLKVDVHVAERSPAQSFKQRTALRRIVDTIRPDLVYTMAGPAYVPFGTKHVLGCSNPYVTNFSFRVAGYGRSKTEAASRFARSVYQGLWCRRADFWIFQTESSRDGFCRLLRVPEARTAVVPNAVGAAFIGRFSSLQSEFVSTGEQGAVRVFCPAASYPHKAIELVPAVAAELRRMKPDAKVVFTVTLEQASPIAAKVESRARELGVTDMVVNMGRFSYFDAPKLNREHDAVYIPSILEVFSTSYLEAIFSRRPLVVSDLPFAREVCGDAATYVKPLDAAAAARGILETLERGQDSGALARASADVLQRFGSSLDRYNKLKQILCKIADEP